MCKDGQVEKNVYLTIDTSPAVLRLSKRLRSCSKANVSEGVDVFIGGAAGAAGVTAGAEVLRCLAATEAGTNDIIVVEGLGAGAGDPFVAALSNLGLGPDPDPVRWPLVW